MNRTQRNSNRENAKKLGRLFRDKELAKHVCENCGKNGGHWVQTAPTSLASLIAGFDDQHGFWTCDSNSPPLIVSPGMPK